MKKHLITFFFVVICFQIHAQTDKNVGIDTKTPTERLDIASGNIRVRDINNNLGNSEIDKVVVASNTGVLGVSTIPREPWNKASSNTPSASNTDNIYQRGFVGSFPDLLSPTNPFPSFNFDATQNVTGIAKGLRLTNNAGAVTGNGVSISLNPVNQNTFNTTFISSVYNGTGGTKSSALLVGNENANTTHLTLELGTDNSLQGNFGINVAQAATEKRPTQKLDVNGNARIRQMADGSNSSVFSSNVVVDANGVLGKKTIAVPNSISGNIAVNALPFTTTADYATTIPILIKNVKTGGDAASYVMDNNNGKWRIDFTDSTNSSSNVSYEIIFIPR